MFGPSVGVSGTLPVTASSGSFLLVTWSLCTVASKEVRTRVRPARCCYCLLRAPLRRRDQHEVTSLAADRRYGGRHQPGKMLAGVSLPALGIFWFPPSAWPVALCSYRMRVTCRA